MSFTHRDACVRSLRLKAKLPIRKTFHKPLHLTNSTPKKTIGRRRLDGELLKTPETRIEDAIKATVELASSLRGQEPPVSRASLPPTANPGFSQIDGAPPPFVSPRLHRYFTENEPRAPSRLDPEIVPEPPEDTRPRFVAPVVVALSVLCSAVIAYWFATGLQLDGRQLKRESNTASVAAPVYNEVIAEPSSSARLVAENRQTFVNEPLLLGISIELFDGL